MRYTACFAALLASTAFPVLAQNIIPEDAKPTCAIDQKTFESWLDKESPNSNRVFLPPDGFSEPFESECAFYQWGAQMFLWLTSPAENTYVFDSTGFFDVVHDAAGTEKVAMVEVLPNGGDNKNQFVLRAVKPDSRGGAEQAGGGGVLLNQRGSLTYYGMHVNDAYVAFRNGFTEEGDAFNFHQGDDAPDQQFPSSADDMDQVVRYGLETGIILDDGANARSAGTLEMKTSWVESASVDPADFLTISATVPRFEPDGANELLWIANGVQDVELALVGMHIAAPVVGHPELVWISYEHLANSPLGSYLYFGDEGGVYGHEFDSSGEWTYANSDVEWPDKIEPNASLNADGNIEAAEGKEIEPQNVVMFNPWGLAAGSDSNLTSNTDLVSLNSSLIQLLGDDPSSRNSYYQIGGVLDRWNFASLSGLFRGTWRA